MSEMSLLTGGIGRVFLIVLSIRKACITTYPVFNNMARTLQALFLLQKAFEHLQLTVEEEGYSLFSSLPARHFWPTYVNWKKRRWSYVAVIIAGNSKLAAVEVDGRPLGIHDTAIARPREVGIVVRGAEGRHVLLPVGGASHPAALVLWGERRERSLWARVTALHTAGPCTWLVRH